MTNEIVLRCRVKHNLCLTLITSSYFYKDMDSQVHREKKCQEMKLQDKP